MCRVFEATKPFLLCATALGAGYWDPIMARYENAQVSALGLTAKQFSDVIEPTSQHFATLPTEHILATSTIWPEIDRIYGHPYEIHSIAVSPSGNILATACKVDIFAS